jgi:lipopolysaccharide transport system ATP-binding protein
MSDVVIRVENLSKCYVIGHQKQERYVSLRDTIADKVKSFGDLFSRNGKDEDPTHEDFWALKDVSFEIKQGDRVGIIGRNGAGKSTLLKILSRITEPTSGKISIKGRVASLLEVGTGFHPELTGRENVYLNGAILGMDRSDIKRKFDEIVAFAEVEKFLDTPVKRYSSGMYVRLAFAVAAHLEPEILIVDEVLAVGDSEFQNKCLGKMKQVSEGGRTVIFVSHNMAAIKNLTTTCCFLASGKILYEGDTEKAIEEYFKSSKNNNQVDTKKKKLGQNTKIFHCRLLDGAGQETKYYTPGKILSLEIDLYTDGTRGLSLDIFLVSPSGEKIAFGSTAHFHEVSLPTHLGRYKCLLNFEPIYLASGIYSFDLATAITNIAWDAILENATSFEVTFSSPTHTAWDFKYSYGHGAIGMVCVDSPKFEKIVLST